MRNLILLVLGVVVGAALGAITVNTLRQRDAYPRGVMAVMQHHAATLHDDVRAGRCTQNAAPDLDELRMLSGEIGEAVYAGDIPDAPFREYVVKLQNALSAAPADLGDCAALAPALDKIGTACEACHREYR